VTQEQKPLSQLEAVDLLDTFDHCYLTVDGARQIAQPFGMKVVAERRAANTGEHKGLTVADAKPGELVEGYDAASLATDLCAFLGVEYMSMFGRGSRLHSACKSLREYVQRASVINA
jgi:hypothetical protein